MSPFLWIYLFLHFTYVYKNTYYVPCIVLSATDAEVIIKWTVFALVELAFQGRERDRMMQG